MVSQGLFRFLFEWVVGRVLLGAGLGLGALTLTAPVNGQEGGDGDTVRFEREVSELRKKIDDLEKRVEESEKVQTDRKVAEEAFPTLEFSPVWGREPLTTPAPFRGVYDKPFLASMWRRAHIGGYLEMEYHNYESGVEGIPEGFWLHRTNLFLFTEITDRVKTAVEIEFETEFEGFTNSSDIEIKLEMAFVDWKVFEELVFRGGAILVPLGRLNVNHDGPIRKFAQRPLVDTFVIPTTFTEPGAGFLGSFWPGESLELNYETYVVNGLNILDANGNLSVPPFEFQNLIRAGRTSLGGDNNGSPAWTGRVGLGLVDTLEAGGSWHLGTYDERDDNWLTMVAGDLAFQYSFFSLQGEIALADFSRDQFAITSGVPDKFWGYYIEGVVEGMPAAFRKAPWGILDDPGAAFALALRFDWINLNGDVGEIIEPGINFRPVADTVFKFSYRFALSELGVTGSGIPGTENWTQSGFVFSISSYF